MQFRHVENPIDDELAENIKNLFSDAFHRPPDPDFQSRVNEKPSLLLTLAYIDNQLIGFKIGYQKHRGTFFSWLGAVSPKHRREGIARDLLKHQHEHCQRLGYAEIQTETQASNRGMLILNLEEGFEVFGSHLDSNDQLVVQLRKQT